MLKFHILLKTIVLMIAPLTSPMKVEEKTTYQTSHKLMASKFSKSEEILQHPITLSVTGSINETHMTHHSPTDQCNSFRDGTSEYEFTSPLFPNKYPNSSNCIKQITAPEGSIIQIQFVDIFQIEEHRVEGICKYDYLEIRDGLYSFSPAIDKFCGKVPPFPHLQSTGRHFWLRFHSDETISYSGFRAIVTFVPEKVTPIEIGNCSALFTAKEGHINTTIITNETWLKAKDYGRAVDCTWIIEAEKGMKIYLQFDSPELILERPNQCFYNFVQIYKSHEEFIGTVDEPRRKCGSIIRNVKSTDNILVMRFYSMVGSDVNKRSQLFANYTIQRHSAKGEKCSEKEEFDCKDEYCIPKSLQCNGLVNCERPLDEEKCYDAANTVTADILVIALIGCILIAGMCGGLLLNIYRKLRQDKLELMELRESIKKSRESMLTEKSKSIKFFDQLNVESSTPATESITTKDTVIERDKSNSQQQNETTVEPTPYKKLRPSLDVKKQDETSQVLVIDTTIPIPYSPPPSYPHNYLPPRYTKNHQLQPEQLEENDVIKQGDEGLQPAGESRKSSEGLIEEIRSRQNSTTGPNEGEVCVEVRDCACQTIESARRNPLLRGEAVEFIASTNTPPRRIIRMLPTRGGADILAIYPFYAASSASSETGRSLERLDELSE